MKGHKNEAERERERLLLKITLKDGRE